MNTLAQNLICLAGFLILAGIVAVFVRSSKWTRQRARLAQNKTGLICFAVIFLYLLIGFSNLVLTPMKGADGQPMSLLDLAFIKVPAEITYSAPMAKVDLKDRPLKGWHLFGTNALGKDVLKETLKGCSTALLIGGFTSLIYIPIGISMGIAAGYYRRWVDDLIQYVYSTIASMPNILLLVSILVVLGKGLPQMVIALGITGWVGLCRLLRGETMRQRERQYCEAARALGQSNFQIVFRHILPNVMHLVLINFVLGFSGLVMAESILSYIGVGMPIGTPSWGAMIDGARMELVREPKVWWNIGAATGALFFFVLCLNLFGDALRRAFDPKSA